MANNRMYLVNTRTGDKIYVAKYYPSTGWYAPKGVEKRLDEGFHAADFGHLTAEELRIKGEQIGFGPPYGGGGMLGEEWTLEFDP